MYKTILALSLMFLMACGNAPQRPEPLLDQNYQPTPVQGNTAAGTPAGTPPPATPEPPQNADGVWHYTCPTGCSGGAGSATPCATCGTTLVHNQLYHSNTPTPQPNIVTTAPGAAAGGGTNISLGDGTSIAPVSGVPGATQPAVTPAAPKAPEPAQNAAGVWHYTCSDGCAGGAGSAVACAGCGKTLVHNSTYHN